MTRNATFYFKLFLVPFCYQILVNGPGRVRKIQPPNPTAEEVNQLNVLNGDHLSGSAKWHTLEFVSRIFQQQLTALQTPTECEHTLHCGHVTSYCGFACQVHQRIACLMISHALKMPLIHDEENGWAYLNKWSDMFRPLGSQCKPGPETFTVQWQWFGTPPIINRKRWYGNQTIEYPLTNGLPVPKELANLVERLHSFPWLWWVGQFIKYGLVLRDDVTIDRIPNIPPVGLHVRRTDKIIEDVNSIHPLEEYFKYAASYFETHGNKKSVFVASDDHLVLEEAVQKYSDWEVHRFPANTTYHDPRQRAHDLQGIVRDLTVLSECDFIICGFSSNICRLLYEIQSHRYIDPWNHIRSLDGVYNYDMFGPIIPMNVLKY